MVVCASVVLVLAPTLTSSSCIASPPSAATAGQRGINVATMMSQAVTIFDHPNVTQTGEPQATYDVLARDGHRLIRLPIDWNFLQPDLDTGNSTFHPAYWRAIKAEVAKIGKAGMRVVLDLHNGCEWTKPETAKAPLICGAGITKAMSANVWQQLSTQFGRDPTVIAYDLFNEPVKFNHPTLVAAQSADRQPYATYQAHVNNIVAALRARGDNKEIWVESLCCAQYLDINKTDPGGGWVKDPINRIVYSLHMYPVANSADAQSFDPAKMNPNYENPPGQLWADRGYVTGFLRRLDDFGRWCRKFQLSCSIGEVGWYGWGQTRASADAWNSLGARWYAIANSYGLAVTYYGASSAYHDALWAYDAPGVDVWFPALGMTRKQPQARVIEDRQNQSK